MTVLTLEQIKTPLPVVAHELVLPEMDTTTFVAELTALERETRVELPYRARREATGDESGLRAFLVAACLCKSVGREFLAVEQQIPALAEALQQWPLKAFDKLFNACEDANGLSQRAQEQTQKN